MSIKQKANRLNLFVSKETRSNMCSQNAQQRRGQKKDYRVNDLTLDINKYTSYILGLIWTDGFVLKNRNTVGITLVKEDMINIEWIFDKTGNWYVADRKRKGRRESRSLTAYNPNFMDSLISLDFDKKSTLSPYKIYEIIPEKYSKYFFRGIIDGDGCFYLNKKNYTYQFTISSTYDQDWSFYIGFFKKMSIDFTIVRRIQKDKNKSSIIRICNRDGIKKLINWLYDGYENDRVGLKRKFFKSKLF